MDENTRKKLYAALSAPFPENCIQRTEGRTTGRGYDTTGIGYQYIVNRINEVLGVGSFRVHRDVTVKEVQRSNGRPAFEAICDLTLELGTWESGKFIVFAESLSDGGHLSSSEADARKGAYTNAFKKAAAFHGVGKQAYEGTLDDDNVPGDTTCVPEQPSRQAPVNTSTVVRTAPPQLQAVPPTTPPVPSGYIRTGPVIDTRPVQAQQPTQPATPERNRLSSKQLGAIHAISRKLGMEPSAFRAKVKATFGCQLEFLSRQQAGQLITELDAQVHNTAKNEEGMAAAAS